MPRTIIRRRRSEVEAAKAVAELDYRALQEKAKDAGIPANQSHEALVKALQGNTNE